MNPEVECSIEGQLNKSIHVHVGGTKCYITITQTKGIIEWQVGSTSTKRYIAVGYSNDFVDALARALSLFFLVGENELYLATRKLLNAAIKSGGYYVKVLI
jgi:hypothetical protein